MNTLFTHFKTLVAPLQLWLLQQGRCVGCGKNLDTAGKAKRDSSFEQLVTCECQRVYVFDQNEKMHRRALLNELS